MRVTHFALACSNLSRQPPSRRPSSQAVPVSKDESALVVGGTINGSGVLWVRVAATSADSTLAQIMRVVADAQLRRPAVQAFADRVSFYFVPVVVVLSAFTWLTWATAVGTLSSLLARGTCYPFSFPGLKPFLQAPVLLPIPLASPAYLSQLLALLTPFAHPRLSSQLSPCNPFPSSHRSSAAGLGLVPHDLIVHCGLANGQLLAFMFGCAVLVIACPCSHLPSS